MGGVEGDGLILRWSFVSEGPVDVTRGSPWVPRRGGAGYCVVCFRWRSLSRPESFGFVAALSERSSLS